MDSSSSFKGKPQQYFDVIRPVPSSRREFETSRVRNMFLKRSATFSYLLLQMAIIVVCVVICATPYWMKCHFFSLTPEAVNNGTTPDFFASNSYDPLSVVSLEPAAQTQNEVEQLSSETTTTTTTTTTTATELSTGFSINDTDESSSLSPTVTPTSNNVTSSSSIATSTKSRKKSTTTTTTPSSPKSRRRPSIDNNSVTPQTSNETAIINATTSSSGHNNEELLTISGAASTNNGSLRIMRRYISADIGLWETCQLDHCQAYSSIWNIFFQIDQPTWWLFICRWICICGVGLTEILWLIVAIIRFAFYNKRNHRRYRVEYFRNRGVKYGDPNSYFLEPIAGVLLLLIKATSVLAIVGALITFRFHTNAHWPVAWRTEHGIIAHMGLSWLGMLAMGSCDLWLFLVTLLHTIAAHRDLRRAKQAWRRNANAFTTAGGIVRRRNSVGVCNKQQQRYNKQCYGHRSVAVNSSQDDSNFYYSPNATNNNYYKPTPYEDDCDYGFNTMPLSRKQSIRQVNSNLFDDYPGPSSQRFAVTSTQVRNNNSNNNNVLMASRMSGRSRNFNNHHQAIINQRNLIGSPSDDVPNSPLYIPHYDDEAIGGRAFY